MKKSLIALAVAGAMTAPIVAQADATLYGSLRASVQNIDTGDTDDWQLTDETSRIGLRGDVDLGLENSTGYFNFEVGATVDEGTFGNARVAVVGVKGDWGAAQAGRMWTPHWMWVSSVANADWNNAEAGGIREVGLRQPNTIAYISPDFGGFQAAAAVIMGNAVDYTGFGAYAAGALTAEERELGMPDEFSYAASSSLGGNNNDDSADAYNVAVKYAAGGLHLGLSYMDVDEVGVALDLVETFEGVGFTVDTVDLEASYDALNLAASYTMDAFKVYGRYQTEELDIAGADSVELDTYQLGAQYTMGNTIMQARWTDIDLDNEFDGNQWMVGVQQNLGKRARVWVEYADVSSEIEEASALGLAGIGGAGDSISIGYRLDF